MEISLQYRRKIMEIATTKCVRVKTPPLACYENAILMKIKTWELATKDRHNSDAEAWQIKMAINSLRRRCNTCDY
jgi:hypothetical protein